MSLLSSSDHSDIVTLGDTKEEAAAASEDLYMGTSCSSQYAFTAAESGTWAWGLGWADFISKLSTEEN